MIKTSFALIALVALPTAAMAADAPAASQAGGFYASIHGGMLLDSTLSARISSDFRPADELDTPIDFDFDDGTRWGGSVGYYLNSNMSIEAEVSNAGFDVIGFDIPNTLPGNAAGTPSVLTIMGNFVIGQNYNSFRPYVGAGLGAAKVSADVDSLDGFNNALHDEDWALAGQVFAGIDYALTDSLMLGARYRYQSIGSTDMSDTLDYPVAIDRFDLQSVDLVLKMAF